MNAFLESWFRVRQFKKIMSVKHIYIVLKKQHEFCIFHDCFKKNPCQKYHFFLFSDTKFAQVIRQMPFLKYSYIIFAFRDYFKIWCLFYNCLTLPMSDMRDFFQKEMARHDGGLRIQFNLSLFEYAVPLAVQ